MKLFYAPGACSLGIHLLMEEIGQPYDAQRVNLREGEQHTPQYQSRNPKAKVPLLERDDGTLLSEYGAISHYLADGTPLALHGREQQARGMEALDYIVGTIHMQGFSRIGRSANFTPNAADEDWVKRRGREIMTRGYALMADALGSREYLFGPISHVDCALFYVEFWSGRADIDLPAPLAAHFARMKSRPAAVRVMAAEGLG